MLRFIIISAFFFLLGNNSLGQVVPQYKWKKIKSPLNHELFFAGGNTTTDFWMYSLTGDLFHYQNGKFQKFSPPQNYLLSRSRIINIGENDFIGVATTLKFEGIVFRYKSGIWKGPIYSYKYPLENIVKTTDNKIYFSGDFGSFFSYTDNISRQIKTPITSHIIQTINVGKDSLILSTKSDGVYLYHDKKFKLIHSSKNINSYIIDLNIVNNTVYALSYNHKVYRIQNDSLVLSLDIPKANVFNKNIEGEKFGFIKKNIRFKKKNYTFSLPIEENINQIKMFAENDLVMLSTDGNIFIGELSSSNYFINMAATYEVFDLPTSKNYGVLFFDNSQSKQINFLVLNNIYGNYLNLYKGIPNSAFSNIISQSNLPFQNNQHQFAAPIDINKDGLTDFVFVDKDTSKYFLNVFRNKGENKFEIATKINLPKDYQVLGLRDLTVADYDADGDEDIIASAYYSNMNDPGGVIVYKNSNWGSSFELDTTLVHLTRKWNEKAVFADINNDNKIDILVTNKWSKDILLVSYKDTFIDETSIRIPDIKKSEIVDAGLVDFDNDGDLDIFTVGYGGFIRLYMNDGNGFFSDVSNKMFSFLDKETKKNINTNNFNLGDFNNDGFVDVFVTTYDYKISRNYLLINDSAKSFLDKTTMYDVEYPAIVNSCVADFDNDGDLDIYGTTNSHNVLWINTLNNKNYLRVKLVGVKSSTSSLGAKIWVYKHNYLNKSDHLVGYRQLGTEHFGKNIANELTAHFGLKQTQSYDLKIKFYAGNEKIIRNVKGGQLITIKEITGLEAIVFQLPGIIYRFFSRSEIQMYLLIILLSHFVLLLGIRIGINRFNWDIKLAIGFTIVNGSLFWLFLFFSTSSSIFYIKYLIPLLIIIFGASIPLLVFFWIQKTKNNENGNYLEKLLQVIMTFSHGEWALRNLDSIKLLSENIPNNDLNNQPYREKLYDRFKIFRDMTYPSILEVIEYAKEIEYDNNYLQTLNKNSTIIIDEISNFEEQNNLDSLTNIKNNVSSIRNILKNLRIYIYSKFSCDPATVINNIVKDFQDDLSKHRIKLIKQKEYNTNIPVLIRGFELANIIDNLFQNSIHFLSDSETKIIKIKLYRVSPKVHIDFSNTGKLLSKEKHEIIFEHGYSESSGTGLGLFVSREILKKYGGRIFVKEGTNKGAAFTIELNEGVLK